MLPKLFQHMTGACKVKNGSNLLLCVSGGVDSTAMLHLIMKLKSEQFASLSTSVVHFNHKRRKESEMESEFVRSLCDQYSVPFYSRVKSDFSSGNFQKSARIWRRESCIDILANEMKVTAGFIVTAHHADDQIETSLLKLLRGVHISRLYGMLPYQEIKPSDKLNSINSANFKYSVIKPMLGLRKSELIEYMREHNYEWHEDSSNLNTDYKRNKIRHEVVPLLKELCVDHGGLFKKFSDIGEQSFQYRQLLDKETIEFVSKYPVQRIFDFAVRSSACFALPVGNSTGFTKLSQPIRLDVYSHVLSMVWHMVFESDPNRIVAYSQLLKIDELCCSISDNSNETISKHEISLKSGWFISASCSFLYIYKRT